MLIHSLPWRLRTADRRENGCERAAVKASGRQNSLKNLVFLFISQTSDYQAITHIQTKFEQTRLSAVTYKSCTICIPFRYYSRICFYCDEKKIKSLWVLIWLLRSP